MTEELLKILEALEKPLRFTSKNDFLNISKVKDLDQLVSDLTLKALSLSLSSDELGVIQTLRESFSGYKELELESKKKLIEESLSTIEEFKKDKHSNYTHTPQTSHSLVKETSIKEDLSQIPIQYVKGVGPRR
ncbi:MAG: ATP-dependent helicase RecG, ATP-dependent helicase RecG, partial [Candidatus Dadabacteria bacterium]|nr:ATP-dependent helicase RecG, ATP-dependent helicase RecG [Candidatus Dadabacteria bacterium]